MPLNPVRPLKSASATATQGSKTVQVSGGVNCSFIRSGSIISIGDKHLVDAVSGTVPDGNGDSTITLRDEWPFATQTARLIAFMAYEGLADAVVRLNQIADAQSGALEGAFSFMGNWSAVAGDFPPVPGDDLGSQMYRISAAGSMGGRAYRVGELIYYDQFTEQWRPLYEGLGTAAAANVTTNPNDTTAGRLLKVGDFGIGSNGFRAYPVSDFNSPGNADVPVGIYSFNTTFDNRPENTTGIVIVASRASGEKINILVTSGTSTPDMYFRRVTESSIGPWQKNYHTGNIVGTVSQSGGVPTGSAMQTITNANGVADRFASGLQISYRLDGNPITSNPASFAGSFASIDGGRLRIGRWF